MVLAVHYFEIEYLKYRSVLLFYKKHSVVTEQEIKFKTFFSSEHYRHQVPSSTNYI